MARHLDLARADVFLDNTPETLASKVLAHHGGDQREAEVNIWSQQKRLHPENNPREVQFLAQAVVALVDRHESPPVARVASHLPRAGESPIVLAGT